MESNWRYNVELAGLSGWVFWPTSTGGFIYLRTVRLAELNPPLIVGGHAWTHVVEATDYGGNLYPNLLRLLTPWPWVAFGTWAPFVRGFPWGFVVFPD